MKFNADTIGCMCVQHVKLFEVRIAQDVDATNSVCQKEHIIAVVPCHFIHLRDRKMQV